MRIISKIKITSCLKFKILNNKIMNWLNEIGNWKNRFQTVNWIYNKMIHNFSILKRINMGSIWMKFCNLVKKEKRFNKMYFQVFKLIMILLLYAHHLTFHQDIKNIMITFNHTQPFLNLKMKIVNWNANFRKSNKNTQI